jgi:hypothetical protein
MKMQALVVGVRVFINVVDAVGVEGAGTANNSVDFIVFAQQQFRQIGTVLTGNSCNQCAL